MQKALDMNLWEDFEVIKQNYNTKDYYNKYISFSKTIKMLPQKELVKKGWLTKKGDLSSLIPLFQNVVDEKFQVLFRKTTTANEALYALWLSRVSNDAKEKIIKGNIASFQGLTKDNLKDIAKLSKDESLILKLPSILATYGIVLIYEDGISGMKLDGAVFKLITGHPVIGISFRFSRIDHFWFTLMHELSHIVLHFDQLDIPIFDDLEEEPLTLVEKQANRLAKNSFVNKSVWRSCKPKYQTDNSAVYEFAEEIGIHPAIVAGLLRHEKNQYTIYSNIINKLNLREMVFGNE